MHDKQATAQQAEQTALEAAYQRGVTHAKQQAVSVASATCTRNASDSVRNPPTWWTENADDYSPAQLDRARGNAHPAPPMMSPTVSPNSEHLRVTAGRACVHEVGSVLDPSGRTVRRQSKASAPNPNFREKRESTSGSREKRHHHCKRDSRNINGNRSTPYRHGQKGYS